MDDILELGPLEKTIMENPGSFGLTFFLNMTSSDTKTKI